MDFYYKEYLLPDSDFLNILSFVDQHPEGKSFDRNLLYLVLADRCFERGDSAHGILYYQHLNKQGLIASANKYEYLEKIFFYNAMKRLSANLAAIGMIREATEIAQLFPMPNEKTIAYVFMAEKVYKQDYNPVLFTFLDSAYVNYDKIDFGPIAPDNDPSFGEIMLLSEIGSNSLNKMANDLLRNVPEEVKFIGVLYRVTGVAYEGNYYRAYTAIPSTLTESEDLQCRSMILVQAAREREAAAGDTRWSPMDDLIDYTLSYTNYVPN